MAMNRRPVSPPARRSRSCSAARTSGRTRSAYEQGHADAVLEVLHLVGERRLGEVHALRRLHEAAGVAERGEGPQVTELEQGHDESTSARLS
jgi:hypothetical protein